MRPYAKALGQSAGDLQEFLMSARVLVLTFDAGKGVQEFLLVLFRQPVVGHGKEALVFFRNVLTQQSHIGAGLVNEEGQGFRISRRRPIRHGPQAAQVLAAQVVFVTHHLGRTLEAGKAPCLQEWKEVGLLLGVMALVGKRLEEVERLPGGRGVQRLLLNALKGQFFQTGEDLLDDAVFALEDVGGVHAWPF
jgi:hypothetical protein